MGGIKSDGGQAAATIEGVFADAGHRVGDSDGGQAATILEGVTWNMDYTITDSQSREICAVYKHGIGE